MLKLCSVVGASVLLLGCGDTGGPNVPPDAAALATAPSSQQRPKTVIATTAATSPPALPRPDLPPLSAGVVINIRIKGMEARTPTIWGETNLPDGTDLMFDVSDDAWRACDPEKPCPNGQVYGSKGTVREGRFQSGALAAGEPLHPGRWQASVLVPEPSVQPAKTRAVIGEKGEHLTGKLVKKTESGTIVEATQLFQVPGN